MNALERQIDRVAEAICRVAGEGPNENHYCLVCSSPQHPKAPCVMIEQFRKEAKAAIKAMKNA